MDRTRTQPLRCHDCDEALTDETVFYVKVNRPSKRIATSARSGIQQGNLIKEIENMNKLVVIVVAVSLIGCAGGMPAVNYQTVNYQAIAELDDGLENPAQAMIDARLHAQEDYQGGIGFLAGAGCGIFGVAGSYVYKGDLPVHRLVDLQNKSSAYVMIYKEAYVQEIRKQRTEESAIGWVLAVLVIIAIYTTTAD